MTGKTGTFAEQMLRAANLNVQFSGDSSGKVVAQDVQSGTTAAYGTIVTLTMDTGAEAPAEEAPAVEENIDLQTRRGDPPAAAAIFIPVNPSKEVLFHAKDSCQ